MLANSRHWLTVGAALAIVLSSHSMLLAQEKTPPEAGQPPLFKEQLTVPDGTPEEKIEFFQRLKQQRPKVDSAEQARAHVQRVFETIAAGTAKMLAGKLTPDQEKLATQAHFEALVILDRLKDKRAHEPMLAMADQLKDSKDRELADYARLQLMQLHMEAAMQGAKGAAAKLLDELKAYCSGGKPSGERFEAVRTVARALEMTGDYAAALQAYDLLNETFHKSGNAQLASAAEDSVKAAHARLGVIGKTVEIESTTLAGKPFDLASLKGKVVLVDFWATWCGPCVRELPNMKKSYELYHDKGFEIVGISLDEDRKTLEGFLKENELPWIMLFSDNTQSTQLLANRFGVEGIPAMMLLGKDGKVITLKARGEDLGKELARLLGPVEEK